MVSPVDKNGGDIRTGFGFEDYEQVSPDGNRLTYTAEPAFGDQPASKFFNQYLASRGGGGWSNRGINLPLGRQLPPAVEGSTTRSSKPRRSATTSAASGSTTTTSRRWTRAGQEGYVNLYRRDLCGGEGRKR